MRDYKRKGEAVAEAAEEPALGPVVPEGQDEVEQFEAVGSITGVQPLTEDDIPEAGR